MEKEVEWSENYSLWQGISLLFLGRYSIFRKKFLYKINLKFCREHAPSIIFMDEIDSIGSSRIESGSGGGDSEVQRTMLELLNQLDGFEPTKNIKVTKYMIFAIIHIYYTSI